MTLKIEDFLEYYKGCLVRIEYKDGGHVTSLAVGCERQKNNPRNVRGLWLDDTFWELLFPGSQGMRQEMRWYQGLSSVEDVYDVTSYFEKSQIEKLKSLKEFKK